MAKITDEQIKVLKEVARDAELLGEFLCKIAYVCYKDTNADNLKIKTEMQTKEGLFVVKLNYKLITSNTSIPPSTKDAGYP